jgi:diguanylate cyclase
MNTLAYTDPITALPNRSVIDHLLNFALAPERQGTFRAAIVFIDLDGFKRINDTLGHDGGDVLLRLASQRILERGLHRTAQTIDTCTDPFGNPCNRLPEDIVFARFAGDEFVAILPGQTDRDALAAVGHAIIDALAAPFRVKNQDVTVGASIGIAITPDDTSSATELLTFADLAMYSSKQAGKARFKFFDAAIHDVIVERAQIEADLRLALQRAELVLHYQPKVDTQTLALCCVEALVRWQHPQRGLLSPAAFIDIAEQVGLMTQLGHHVLALAVAQCRAWLDLGIERPVAVNVSPSQFADTDFVRNVLKTLHEADVPARLISIEITESIAMTDFDTTVQRLSLLRAAGVRVAIDDFGIGFSNLSQLARLPLDELKIDRSLISEIGRSRKSEAIICAIIGMTSALGYRTIAEGIETPEQLAFLAKLRCDSLQGYLFGRPMAPQQFEQWLADRDLSLRPDAGPASAPAVAAA